MLSSTWWSSSVVPTAQATMLAFFSWMSTVLSRMALCLSLKPRNLA